MRLSRHPDVLSGFLLVLIGGVFALAARSYPLGQAARPGPAYFPFWLGLLLAGLGLLIVLQAWHHAAPADRPRIAWRPLACVVGAIVLFALALPRLGLWITLPLTVLLVSCAGRTFRWHEVLVNAAVLTVGSWLVFGVALKLPLPLLP